MRLSDFDISNMPRILSGHGDWFSADLLRLMAKADSENLTKLANAYPEVFIEFMRYHRGGVPHTYAIYDNIFDAMEFQRHTSEDPVVWLDYMDQPASQVRLTHGRDF